MPMVATNRVHIISQGNSWKVKREGNQRATRVFSRQGDAIRYTSSTMSTYDRVVHKKDGSFSRWTERKSHLKLAILEFIHTCNHG